MLIHDRFVVLHLQKTGGTFLTKVLERELEGSLTKRGAHQGWRAIPPEAADRPVLAFVRNPWDWYVSWYHFNMLRPSAGNRFSMLSESGRLDFAATVRNACVLVREHRGDDLYTVFFKVIAGDGIGTDRLTIGRFESLLDDLEAFLDKAGVTISAEGVERMRSTPPVNVGTRGHYRDYYDETLRDLVGESCGMVERFDYRF